MTESYKERLLSHVLGYPHELQDWSTDYLHSMFRSSLRMLEDSNYHKNDGKFFRQDLKRVQCIQENDRILSGSADSRIGDDRFEPSEPPPEDRFTEAISSTNSAPRKTHNRRSVSDGKQRVPNRLTLYDIRERAYSDRYVTSSPRSRQSLTHDADEGDELIPLSKNKSQGHRTRQNSRLSSRQSISQDLDLINRAHQKKADNFQLRPSFQTPCARGRSSRQEEENPKPSTFIPRRLEVILMRRMSSKLTTTCRFIDIMILQTVQDDRYVLAIVKDPGDVSDMKNKDYLLRVKLTFNCVPNPANNYIAGYLAEVKARGRLYQFKSKHNEFKVRGVVSQCFLIRTT